MTRVGETLRVVTLNLAHGRGTGSHQALLRRRRIHENLDGVAALLRRLRADVVGLQEADGPSWWSGGFDHVDYLARRAEYPHQLRGAHRRWAQLDCGTALLSHRPLEESLSVPLWSGALRPAKGFVAGALVVGRQVVDVVSVHVDFMLRQTRRKQLGRMATHLKQRGRPVILLGDLNCDWQREPTLRELATRLDLVPHRPEAADLATFPQGRPKRRIDWILVTRGLEYDEYEVVPHDLSDHRAIVAEISGF